VAVLTRSDILEYVVAKKIVFTPGLDTYQLQDHSVDLRLGYTFLIPKSWRVTKAGRVALRMDYFAHEHPEYFDIVELEKGQYFELLPGEHILVSSLESVALPNDLMAVMYPRSTTNRKGISVDLTGIIDSGYEGQLVIPIRNNTSSQSVRLYPGERFCQLVFEQLAQEVSTRKSRYHQRDIIDGAEAADLGDGSQIEVDLILSGDVKKLKTNYPASVTEHKGV
jgi:dCTP deaminase